MLSAITVGLSTVGGIVPAYAVNATETESVIVGFASPAICTDVGQTVDLSTVSVQFTLGGQLVAGSEITWKDGDTSVTSYTPSAKGVYPLTATAGADSRTIFVVAKTPEETEYVLYENDFSIAPDLSEFLVVEQSNDSPVSYDESAGALVLDASGSDANYVRVLLPSYLDHFGDAVISANLQVTEPYNNNRYGSFMFRVQNADSTAAPYMHSLRATVSVLGTSLVYYENEDGEVSNTYTDGETEYFKLRFAGRAVREITEQGNTYKLKYIKLRVTTAAGASKDYAINVLTDRCTAYADFAKVLRGKNNDTVYSIQTIGVYEAVEAVAEDLEVYSEVLTSKSYNELNAFKAVG